jgi:hypothetical protein
VTAARSAPSRGGPSATGTYFRAARSRSSLVFSAPQRAFFAGCFRVCSTWNAPVPCVSGSHPRCDHADLQHRVPVSRETGTRPRRNARLLAMLAGRVFHVEHTWRPGVSPAAHVLVPSTDLWAVCGCSTWNSGARQAPRTGCALGTDGCSTWNSRCVQKRGRLAGIPGLRAYRGGQGST